MELKRPLSLQMHRSAHMEQVFGTVVLYEDHSWEIIIFKCFFPAIEQFSLKTKVIGYCLKLEIEQKTESVRNATEAKAVSSVIQWSEKGETERVRMQQQQVIVSC